MPFQNMTGTGLRPQGSGAGGFLEGILAGVETSVPAYKQAKETQRKTEQEKVNTYVNLRKAGYTKEEAAEIATGQKKFGASLPTGTDEYERDKKKEDLDIQKKTLDVEKAEADKAKGWQSDATATEKWRSDIQKAKSGEIDWDDLVNKYPDKYEDIKEMKKQFTPPEKNPNFVQGTGGLFSRIRSKISSNVAELNTKTKAVIDQIDSQAKLAELIERKEEAEAKGIDVDAILEYFKTGI